MIRLLLPVLLVLLAWPPFLRAEVIRDLYVQSELLPDQSVRQRQAAYTRALEHVMVRVSGDARVVRRLRDKNAFPNAERLVDAWRYESTDETIEVKGKEQTAIRLVLSFSRSGVEKVLREQRQYLWSSNRPAVLYWLVRDSLRDGREMVSLQAGDETPERQDDPRFDPRRDDQDEISSAERAQHNREAVTETADNRGLPVILPLLDLEDQVSISANQLWRLDESTIIDASSRYQPDAILVGRYSQMSSGSWLGTWTLLHRGQREVLDVEASSEDELLAQGTSAVADVLARMYAIVPGMSEENAFLVLKDVGGFAEYIAVQEYLDNVEVIRNIHVQAVANNQLWVELELEGGIDSLRDAIDLDRRLLPIAEQQRPEPLPRLENPRHSEAPAPMSFTDEVMSGKLDVMAPAPSGVVTGSVVDGQRVATPTAREATETRVLSDNDANQFSEPGSRDNPLQYRWTQ